jgi:PTH2 family peptidyl-tRNA hydrolase
MKKMVIAVRSDLDMGKGKIAGQVAHAAVALILDHPIYSRIINEWYEQDNQTKVIVKVNSLDELLELEKNAIDNGFRTKIIHDMGKTQIVANTITCLGIGPDESEDMDRISKHLKLL